MTDVEKLAEMCKPNLHNFITIAVYEVGEVAGYVKAEWCDKCGIIHENTYNQQGKFIRPYKSHIPRWVRLPVEPDKETVEKIKTMLDDMCSHRVGIGCDYNYDCKEHTCNTELAHSIPSLIPAKRELTLLTKKQIFPVLYQGQDWETYHKNLTGQDAQKIDSYVSDDYLKVAQALKTRQATLREVENWIIDNVLSESVNPTIFPRDKWFKFFAALKAGKKPEEK